MTTKHDIPTVLPLEMVALDQLKSHPRNYQNHPEDEIVHLKESIQENGVYRNIVVAKDGTTILAGHGVAEAARRVGLQSIPVYRTPYEPDDPRALKLLIADNEISHLAARDDRLLTDLLRELKDSDLVDLLGTGYDDMMLANLLFVTRPASEIADLEAAEQWVGMPEYDVQSQSGQIQIIVNFANEEDRKKFCRLLNLDVSKISTSGTGKSIWWPARIQNDEKSLYFTDKEQGKHE